MRLFALLRITIPASIFLFLLWMVNAPTVAEEPPAKAKDDEPSTWTPAHETLVKNPKPLSKNAKAAIDFLVKTQNADGSWGGGPLAMGFGGIAFGEGPKGGKIDVGNTSIGAMALMRAGFSPKKGTYSTNLNKAITQIMKAIEDSDKDSLNLATVPGSQIQGKIGANVDTYLAAIALATAKGAMPDKKSEIRLEKTLQKIVDKMEKNQNADGSWKGAGWAPVLSQAMASRAINMAKQVGMAVDNDKLEKTAQHAKDTFKQWMQGVGQNNAGVDLYSAAAAISAMQDAVNTNRFLRTSSQSTLRSPEATARAKDEATKQLARLTEHEKALQEALRVMAKKSLDNNFVRGFGSDGGEEFISFALIGEALLANGLKEFTEWDKAMTNRLVNSQNGNGSWSGKHCISGETFCTATAAMTMSTDRAFRPVGSELASRGPNKPDTNKDVAPPSGTPNGTDSTRNDLPDPKPKPIVAPPAESEAAKLYKELKNGGETGAILTKLRDGKGSEYTDVLAIAASKLEGTIQSEARAALAHRLTRMKADTLRRMLQDEDKEIRRAAALACAMKDDKNHVPDLIPLLADADASIARAGRTALKNLTGQDFGPEPTASGADKAKAILTWRNWWNKQPK